MRPRPWIAGLLSLLVPGLGQVYAGRLRRGIGLWLLGVGLTLTIPFLLLHVPGPFVMLAFALPFAAWFSIIIDSMLAARRQVEPLERRVRNRWYVYPGVLVVFAIVIQPQILRVVRSVARTLTATSVAMEPTLLEGDSFVANVMDATRPGRAEVVTYRWPGDSSLVFFHRIVGIPGDTLAMRGGLLYVNGGLREEPYARHIDPATDTYHDWMAWQTEYLAGGLDRESYHPTRDNWGPILVPPGRYFLMGDNRDESLDSRYRGFVRAEDITGRVRRVYFSWNGAEHHVRWERIGRGIQ